jgi:hypothetical protein
MGMAKVKSDLGIVRRPMGKVSGKHVELGAWERDFLALRGARSHRGGGEFSRSVVVDRLFTMLKALLENADPRQSLPQAVYEVAITLLPQGWLLKPLEVRYLDEVLAAAEGFEQSLESAGMDRRVLLEAVAGLSFAEKYALVDLAVQAHAAAGAADNREGGG